MKTELVEVTFSKESPERLDKFLAGQIASFSRARIQGMITAGDVLVNGKVVSKASYKFLPYHVGMNIVERVIKKGKIVI